MSVGDVQFLSVETRSRMSNHQLAYSYFDEIQIYIVLSQNSEVMKLKDYIDLGLQL